MSSAFVPFATFVPFAFLVPFIYFTNLSSPSIWDANEAFYVETPREMIERGDFIVPYFNFEPRLNKPVLSYWMVAGLYKLFGISVGVQRFGIAIGALIIIACAGCLGWIVSGGPAKAGPYRDHGSAASVGAGFGRPVVAGLIAAAGLAVDPRLVMFARRIFIDIWVTAFMSLTLVFFALSERFPERRRLFLVAMYASVGLGVLTKGPIAAILPAIVFALYLGLHRELRRLRDMMLPAGVLIVLAVALPWYAALYYREGWAPIVSFFVGENIGRYTSGIGFQSPRGVFFYLPVVFADAFPLSIFLIPAAVLLWRERWLHPRTCSLCWLWVLAIVAFFSFSHDKQDLYVLPIVIAVAALGANAITRRDTIAGGVRATCMALGLVVAVAGGIVLYASWAPRPDYISGAARFVGIVAVAGGTFAAALALRGRVVAAVTAALTTLLIANWLVVARILSDLEQHKPVPVLTAYLRERITPEDVLSTYNIALPSMVYYLQRRVNVYYAAEPFVADATAERRMFGILSEADYAALGDRIQTDTCVRLRVPAFEVKLKRVLTGARAPQLVLISNRCGAR